MIGLAISIAGNTFIRFFGGVLLHPERPFFSILLFAISFVLMAVLVRAICAWLRLAKSEWFQAAALLCLPTLILDPFSCLFFSTVFPNISPAAAGIYGGWMLMCCGGGLTGAVIQR